MVCMGARGFRVRLGTLEHLHRGTGSVIGRRFQRYLICNFFWSIHYLNALGRNRRMLGLGKVSQYKANDQRADNK
jgi:hypothetical protein